MYYKVDVAAGFVLEEIPANIYLKTGNQQHGIILSMIDGGTPNEMGFICRQKGEEIHWEISNPGPYSNVRIQYGQKIVSSEKLLNLIIAECPQDLDIFLFHPEIFEGKWIQ